MKYTSELSVLSSYTAWKINVIECIHWCSYFENCILHNFSFVEKKKNQNNHANKPSFLSPSLVNKTFYFP